MKRSAAGETSIFVPILCVLLGILAILSIAFVAKVRRETKEELDNLRGYLAKAQAEYDTAVANTADDKRPSFENVEAKDARISWDGIPYFHFTLTNGSSHAIDKIEIRAVLNQYQPVFQNIAAEKIAHELDTPLQPLQSRAISVSSRNASLWGGSAVTDSLTQTEGFRFHVAIHGAEGAGVQFKEKSKPDSSKLWELTERIEKYKRDIQRLE